MSETNKLQLKQSSILHVPICNYAQDFTFLVNGEQYKTSQFISDLLSPNISKIHLIDPTFETFTIKTTNRGHFSHILNLVNFDEIIIPENELPFIAEVIEILGAQSFEFTSKFETKITNENVFKEIQIHEKYINFFAKNFEEEIDFISSNFFDLCQNHEDEFANLQINTIIRILDNEKLKLKDEDQLLNFINQLYSKNVKYSVLYEKVYFTNVSSKLMNEFVNIFNFNDITFSTWTKLCNRLICELKEDKFENHKDRYMQFDSSQKNEINENKGIILKYNNNNEFSGIFNFLRKKSNENIENDVTFSSSSVHANVSENMPSNVVLFENQNKRFISSNIQNSWICFDFKDHRVIPTEYTIKSSILFEKNMRHPKNWVIEGSNDNENWEILDEEKDCSEINGKSIIHTFAITNNNSSNKYKLIRMRETGQNWDGSFYLLFDSFEIYGTYI